MFTGRFVALVSLSLVLGIVATFSIFLVSVLLYSLFHNPEAGVSLTLLKMYVIGVWLLWIWLFITPRALPKSIAVWINIALPLVLGIFLQNDFPRVFEGGLFVSSCLVAYNALVKWGILYPNA